MCVFYWRDSGGNGALLRGDRGEPAVTAGVRGLIGRTLLDNCDTLNCAPAVSPHPPTEHVPPWVFLLANLLPRPYFFYKTNDIWVSKFKATVKDGVAQGKQPQQERHDSGLAKRNVLIVTPELVFKVSDKERERVTDSLSSGRRKVSRRWPICARPPAQTLTCMRLLLESYRFFSLLS